MRLTNDFSSMGTNTSLYRGAVGSRRSEAELMKKYLVEKGVPAKRVLKEDKSHNTVQNLILASN